MTGATKTPKLGGNQKYVLDSLAERNNGSWYPGCGWVWDGITNTIRILRSMVKHGVVTEEPYEPKFGRKSSKFTITDAGRAFLDADWAEKEAKRKVEEAEKKKQEAKDKKNRSLALTSVERGTAEAPAISDFECSDNHMKVTIAVNPSDIVNRGFPWQKVEVFANRNLFGHNDTPRGEWEPATVRMSCSNGDAEEMMRAHAAAVMGAGIAQFLDFLTGAKEDCNSALGNHFPLGSLADLLKKRWGAVWKRAPGEWQHTDSLEVTPPSEEESAA